MDGAVAATGRDDVNALAEEIQPPVEGHAI